MTAKERQLWYWRREMQSCHRCMRVYPEGSEGYRHWKERYESAVRAYNEISGMDLKPEGAQE